MPSLEQKIQKAKRILDAARIHGDKLQIELAEDGLNDLLDRVDVTDVPRNNGEPSDATVS